MSNLGPLTTTYVPNGANCQSIFMTSNGILIYGTNWDSHTSTCMPTNFVPVNPYYYSPGICPSGYSYACFAALGNGVSDGGTAATCCPTGYGCRKARVPGDSAACSSRLQTDGSLAINQFVNAGTGTLSALVTGVYVSGSLVFANGVVLRRGDGDPSWPIGNSTTSASAIVVSTTLASTTTGSPVSESATPVFITSPCALVSSFRSTASTQVIKTQNAAADPDISAATKVHIGAGVALGILVISGIMAIVYLIRKQKKKAVQENLNADLLQQTAQHSGNPKWPINPDAVELEEQRRYCELVAAHAREPVELYAN